MKAFAPSGLYPWRLLVPLLVLSGAATLYWVAQRERVRELERTTELLQNSVQSAIGYEADVVEYRRRSVLFLAKTPPTAGIVRALANGGVDVEENTSLGLWVDRLQTIFAAYIEANPEVFQVRLIGAADGGREVVRVDRRGDRIEIVPEQDLQAKGDRDYFIDTMRLQPGQVYVSDINLNREHGRVEVPHRPTARAATPIADTRGGLFGILVINIEKAERLEDWRNVAPAGGALYVVNQDGDFILHPDSKRSFGFDLGQRYRWQDEFTPASDLATAAPLSGWLQAGQPVHVAEARLRRQKEDSARELRFLAVLPDAVVRAAMWKAVLGAGALLAGSALSVVGVAYWLWRRRMEALSSQARLAAIVENSSDAIIGLDMQGTITSWNGAAENIFGYPSEEVIGRSLIGLLAAAGRSDEAQGILARVTRGETIGHFDTTYRHRDGHGVELSLTVSPVPDASGTIIGAAQIARDITATKRTQQELDKAQSRLLQTTHAMGIGLWEWNLDSGAFTWDDTMFELYGLTRNETQPNQDFWRNQVHADDIARVSQEIEAALSGLQPFDTSFRVVHPSGAVRHILAKAIVERDDSGQARRMLGTNFDITQLKEQEEGLRTAVERIQAGEARWRELANSMPQLVWTCSGDGPCDFLSDQWVEYTGVPESEQLGSGWVNQVHPDDRAELAQRWQVAVDSRGVFRVEFRIRRHDGAYRWFDTRAVPQIDPFSGNVVRWFGSNTDIEDRKQAENAVRRLNATLEQQVAERTARLQTAMALQSAILSDAAFGIISTEPDGTITAFNPAAERMLGYRAEEMIGKLSPAVIHDPGEIAARAQILSAELGRTIEPGFEVFVAKTRGGTPDTNEWTYIRKDGTRFPVWLSVSALLDEQRRPMGFVGMIVDLSDRREQELKLRNNERFLRTLTDNIPGMVGYWDTELRCKYANRECFTWFGKTPEEMRGLRLPDLLGPTQYSRNKPYVDAALSGQVRRFERAITRHDGTKGHTWAHYIPDIDDGVVRGFYEVVTDVSELKQAQIMLESLNRDLEVRTREAEAANVAKSQFLANMSHEIRSPMNAILGMLQLLLDTDLAMRQRDYAAKALSATQSLLHLLNDILDFSKIEAGKIALENQPFSLDAVLSDVSGIVASTIGNKPVELLFALGAALPQSLIGDAFRLRQVLLNLIGNAIKFTQRGEIVVSISPIVIDERHLDVDFEVRDTGIGIPADKLSFIFEGFSQAEASTTRRFGGTGLGLAISRRLVELMGGSLGVESEPGVGSRFHFRLRFERDGTCTGEPAAASTKRVSDRPLRVLIVDDNRASRDALAGLVSSLGWRDECAASGDLALKRLAGHIGPPPFDLILVDWKMPDLDGWETARRMRQMRQVGPSTVILMLTAYEHGELTTAMQSEPEIARGILVKPITPSMLFDAMIERAPDRVMSAAQGRSPVGLRRLSGLRLLVVEDNAMNQQVARELLSKEGAIVDIADGGAAGVERTLRADLPFDAVLMDIQMPEMDGFEATRRIRQSPGTESLPIIAMTANAMASDRAACLAAGMNDHIPKPIDLDRVVAVILSHCRPQAPHTPAGSSAAPSLGAGVAQTDIESALARIGGNRALLVDLARRFGEDAGPMISELDRCARMADHSRTAALLHTLKGMAGTVGATAVARRCEDLEQRIKSPSAATLTMDSVAELVKLAAAARQELANSMPELGNARPNESAVPGIDLSSGSVLLDELDRLLASANMRAVDVFTQLEHEIGEASGDRIAPLAQAMRRLDFKRARSELQQLRDILRP